LSKIKLLETARSLTGRASYSQFDLNDNTLYFIRDSSMKLGAIKVNGLYKAYLELDFINTRNVKPYFEPERVNSPACAILIAMGLYDKRGFRKPQNE